jgi:hypothetical protein
MAEFRSFSGIIASIGDFWTGAEGPNHCYKLISLQGGDGSVVNFVVSPDTYFVDNATMTPGVAATGFYDINVPVPMIYPPQYRAVVMARASQNQNVKVAFFDSQLVSSDGMLKLNIGPYTPITAENNQFFTGSPANRNLVVVYGPATMSIPAQTTPYRIIVLCRYTDGNP